MLLFSLFTSKAITAMALVNFMLHHKINLCQGAGQGKVPPVGHIVWQLI